MGGAIVPAAFGAATGGAGGSSANPFSLIGQGKDGGNTQGQASPFGQASSQPQQTDGGIGTNLAQQQPQQSGSTNPDLLAMIQEALGISQQDTGSTDGGPGSGQGGGGGWRGWQGRQQGMGGWGRGGGFGPGWGSQFGPPGGRRFG